MAHIRLSTLRPLHVIGKYLGIWPSFDTNTMAKCGRHYYFGILALFIVLIEHSYNLNGRIASVSETDASIFIMALLADITTTLMNVVAIINTNFRQGGRLHDFLMKIQELEVLFKSVKKDELTCTESRNFYVELAIGNLVFAVYMAYNNWQWTKSLGWEFSQYTVMRDLQFYHIFVMVLLMRNYVLLINYKLQSANYVLDKHVPRSAKSSGTPRSQQNGSDRLFNDRKVLSAEIETNVDWDLDFVSKVYTKISTAIDDFNDIFGWNLAVLQIQMIVNLLNPLNLALVYSNGDFLKDTAMDYNMYILFFIWFIVPLAYMMTIISACDRTKGEANKMPKICYNLLMNFPKSASAADEEHIRKIKDLALQGRLQAPEFTAAGFFIFNYSLVFPTITSVISYFIILLQFRA